ncbi:MAG: hypothetical protein KatS3mg013_0102 [Actinomycetota bacterium]|jgi:protein-tyrosine phosphatase|nr:MAG: hypothetical protein KatS3mg013_0102 [Actinomycetota bacterium]
MSSILVVCTGNVCRSPIAEGLLRRALGRRLGDEAPQVTSAGTDGWAGSGATDLAIRAAAERGVDIASHVARRLEPGDVEEADLVVAMAREHREHVVALVPSAADRTFTLKELVRLLDGLDLAPGADLAAQVGAAAAARRARAGAAADEDVADPLGEPLETYRAIAWELEGWIERLAEALAPSARTDPADGAARGGTG